MNLLKTISVVMLAYFLGTLTLHAEEQPAPTGDSPVAEADASPSKDTADTATTEDEKVGDPGDDTSAPPGPPPKPPSDSQDSSVISYILIFLFGFVSGGAAVFFIQKNKGELHGPELRKKDPSKVDSSRNKTRTKSSSNERPNKKSLPLPEQSPKSINFGPAPDIKNQLPPIESSPLKETTEDTDTKVHFNNRSKTPKNKGSIFDRSSKNEISTQQEHQPSPLEKIFSESIEIWKKYQDVLPKEETKFVKVNITTLNTAWQEFHQYQEKDLSDWFDAFFLPHLDALVRWYSLLAKEMFLKGKNEQLVNAYQDVYKLIYNDYDTFCSQNKWFHVEKVNAFQTKFEPRDHEGIGSINIWKLNNNDQLIGVIIEIQKVGLLSLNKVQRLRKARVIVGA